MSNPVEAWSLTPKEYNQKINKLQDNILLLTPCSKEWMTAIFQQWLHILNPHPWQIKHSLSLCNNQEVFITSRTGSGKSTLTLAPIIARQVLKNPYIAIAVYPTEALITNQVRFKPEFPTEEDFISFRKQRCGQEVSDLLQSLQTQYQIFLLLPAAMCGKKLQMESGM